MIKILFLGESTSQPKIEKSPQEDFAQLQQKIQEQQHILQQRTLQQNLGLNGKQNARASLPSLPRPPSLPSEPVRNVVQNHILSVLQQHLLNRTQEK